jgi:hypothetical protein
LVNRNKNQRSFIHTGGEKFHGFPRRVKREATEQKRESFVENKVGRVNPSNRFLKRLELLRHDGVAPLAFVAKR